MAKVRKGTFIDSNRSEKHTTMMTLLENLVAIDVRELARTEELGPSINFSSAIPAFEELMEPIRALAGRDLTRLPTVQMENVINGANHLWSLVQRVKAFDISANQPKQLCETIITEVKNGYDHVISPLLIPLAFSATQSSDLARMEREARGCLKEVQDNQEQFFAELKKIKEEATEALAAVKAQAAEAGVASNATIFQNESAKHAELSRCWLWATIASGFTTILAATAAFVLVFYYTPPSYSAAVQYVISKVILLSLCSFVLMWCTRMYRAQMHNATLYAHRANALKTFQAFVAGTSDEAVKDAVLLHAAQAAFGARPTGFDSNDADNHPISPVVEVFGRSVGKSVNPS